MEVKLEKYIKNKITTMGGRCLKFVCPSFTGVPDRIVLMPKGKIYFVETKYSEKGPRARQKSVHTTLRNLGFEVWVIKSKEQTQIFLDSITADQKEANGN